jgi:hypothetical protein
MVWPGAIERAIGVIDQAPFLSQQQKRDIFYNNAVRFLRLSREDIARHFRSELGPVAQPLRAFPRADKNVARRDRPDYGLAGTLRNSEGESALRVNRARCTAPLK